MVPEEDDSVGGHLQGYSVSQPIRPQYGSTVESPLLTFSYPIFLYILYAVSLEFCIIVSLVNSTYI